jgi:para-nitrobenzyl esterase
MLLWVLLVAACAKKETPETRTAADSPAVDARPGMLPVPGEGPAGGPWHWVGSVTTAERIDSPDPARYTIEFASDTLLAAQIDCNRGSGSYHRDGGSIRIGPLATTRMMCPPGSKDTVFAQHLDASRAWSMQGDTLVLDLVDDSGKMRFVR